MARSIEPDEGDYVIMNINKFNMKGVKGNRKLRMSFILFILALSSLGMMTSQNNVSAFGFGGGWCMDYVTITASQTGSSSSPLDNSVGINFSGNYGCNGNIQIREGSTTGPYVGTAIRSGGDNGNWYLNGAWSTPSTGEGNTRFYAVMYNDQAYTPIVYWAWPTQNFVNQGFEFGELFGDDEDAADWTEYYGAERTSSGSWAMYLHDNTGEPNGMVTQSSVHYAVDAMSEIVYEGKMDGADSGWVVIWIWIHYRYEIMDEDLEGDLVGDYFQVVQGQVIEHNYWEERIYPTTGNLDAGNEVISISFQYYTDSGSHNGVYLDDISITSS